MKQFIENQYELTGHGLGKYTMNENGCGPIALYNLIVDKWDISEEGLFKITKMCDKRVWFNGKFGILPWQMKGIIETLLFTVKLKICKNWLDPFLDWIFPFKPIKGYRAAILFYWNDIAFHYAFLDSRSIAHNSYNKTTKQLSESIKGPVILYLVSI